VLRTLKRHVSTIKIYTYRQRNTHTHTHTFISSTEKRW